MIPTLVKFYGRALIVSIVLIVPVVAYAGPKRKTTPTPTQTPSPVMTPGTQTTHSNTSDGSGFFILVMIGVVAYFIPTAVAAYRKHPNSNSIFLVNLLLGGCFGIGWIVALVWALSAIDVTKKYR